MVLVKAALSATVRNIRGVDHESRKVFFTTEDRSGGGVGSDEEF
jgi:hypothetical protein